MLERYLVEHCSPTLASLKTANLFSYSYPSEDMLYRYVEAWHQQLSVKGVSVEVLRKKDNVALIYVYRRDRLGQDLSHPDTAAFLQDYGYENLSVTEAIARLKGRFEQGEEFPHEIGLFLGYPLGDVKGFIQNAGKNSKCAGCWKVYCDECEAVKLFAKFKKCRDVYTRLFQQGRTVLQLTVAV
ncbi:DUF3793 family protein [Solibaculum mannosilyticum]|uniref:DUF3793 domain-containing protein n=1 Tax=Solibaculum mannosilyticum TaxID=2780922 RepID=A0A7I8D2Y4_9FIRM|nr:DUF3793 family protein [Solibaculum mannosilyticum]MCO7136881.1 DUF3793 family protein [[Clostridium] leptum]BCI59829.1 hypothetical protein C12CBH8_04680 [Solibaculum mannosilyticum]CZT56492.1 hypothetical protein BN3661_01400 [Eubacteriaceae bacterium CHKCI005]